jgi:hypothetical protein
MMATALGFPSFFLLERYTSLHKAREHHAALPGHASELGTVSAAVFAGMRLVFLLSQVLPQ